MQLSAEFVQNLRQEYKSASLDESDTAAHPMQQFKTWFEHAVASKIYEPNVMTLATASTNGIPSARIVLLKGFDDEGFSFFSNYQSKKGQQLLENPQAALVFFWAELERQVRIEGEVLQLDAEASTAYFKSRPIGSQIGAWASPQSQVIANRAYLEKQAQHYTTHFQDKAIERPAHWGGYILKPRMVEFWQGRESRLHDRICYEKHNQLWVKNRLAP